MSVVLVCGPRDFGDEDAVWQILDALNPAPRLVIQGGAGGVDMHAAWWARGHGIATETHHADWRAHGRAAGPRRNAAMLRDGRPDLLVAIKREGHETRGTSDMLRQARAAVVPIRIFRVAPDGSWREEASADAAPGGEG